MRIRSASPCIAEHLAEMRMAGLSDNYIRCRRTALLRMERRLRKSALSVTAADLDSYQRALPGNPACRAAELCHIGRFYGWAHRRRHIRVNPATVLIRPKRPRRLPRPMTETNVCTAIGNAPPRLKPMIVLMAFAGLRSCEIAALDRADVFDQQIPPHVVVRGKGNRERVVPLSRTALAALREYGMPAAGPLFARRDGKPGHLSASQVCSLVNRYLRSVGVSEPAHALRHRFATGVYQRTKDLRVTQELLGHTSPATTAIYTAVVHDELTRAVTALDDPIGA